MESDIVLFLCGCILAGDRVISPHGERCDETFKADGNSYSGVFSET